jgi:photosystem II stability/assembly factor-like uncharacterized protein
MRLQAVTRIGLMFSALVCTLPAQQRAGAAAQESFRFRFVGPAVGNRVASIAGVPGDSDVYYAGAASGGVWKSTDGGQQWTPIFDNQPVQAIGALAVAPSDPNIVWAGTGEAWAIRDSDMMGDGMYKSSDAGKTWVHVGLDETGRIGRVIVHPTNPDIVYACALGRTTGPQQERGVYRTVDGGAHWERVLFADENTGCSGLSMDAHNPRTLIAGMWQVEMHTWGLFSGGPGSGIYVSHDGGAKWTHVEARGLPKPPVGKIDVAIAPTSSNRVYALIQTSDQGSLWRSDDAGENWRVVNWDRALIGRAGYYIRVAVSTGNENEVLVSNSSFHVSTDGGETFRTSNWGGGDNHEIWIDPKNPDRWVVTHDAGMTITTQHGRSTRRVTLPIGQMYHVAVDNQIPYFLYSNMQDDGTMRGVSTMPESGGGRGGGGPWEHGLGGCESGFTLPDLTDTNIVWSSCYGNEVTRYDSRTKRAHSVSPWIHTLDSEPNKAKYRCHWTPPLATDPFDHNTVYYGCQVIFKTSNGGQSWSVISPDLSTQDPAHNMPSGGIVGDNLGQFYGEVVFAIAPSEVQKGLIWAGTNDGKLWNTRDAGGHWNDVTKNIAGMPAWGVISKIEPSHFDPGTAYIAVDLHLVDNRDAFLYKTTDFGQTWTRISSNLPKGPLAYVRAVAEDPNRKGLLFAGTGNAFYYSLDDGGHWTPLDTGLPHAPVTWIATEKQFHDVVISTYGRGLYILDDVTPLEQMTEGSSTTTRLFAPRPTYRFSRQGRAFLNYTLASTPRGPVQLDILDSKNSVIRTLRPQGRQGLNRAAWDMRYEPARLIALRSTPPENPHIWEEPRFRGADSRPVTHWGIPGAEAGPMVVPGKYTVRLTVDGQSFTQPLEIVKDPATTASQADLEASVRLMLRIRDDISACSDMVNPMEWMRKQLEEMRKMLASQKDKGDLQKSVAELDQKILAVETKILERSQMLSDDKYYVEQYQIYMNLIWLNGEVGPGAGDVAGGTDFGPTETSLAVFQSIDSDLTAVKTEFRTLMDKDVLAFNRIVSDKGITPLAVGAPDTSGAAANGRRP